MTSFDFLASLVIIRSIPSLTIPVTQLLQGLAIDLLMQRNLIESLKSLICCKRNTVDTLHKKCYSDIVKLACKIGIKMERRFDHGFILVYGGLVIIPSKMMSLVYKNVNWNKKFSLVYSI